MPPKYPCIVCNTSVRNNQNALLCVSCKSWCHLKCTPSSIAIFNETCDWISDKCLFCELPFSTAERNPGIVKSNPLYPCIYCSKQNCLRYNSFCCTCNSELFPFNHYDSNDQFLWSLFSYFKLNEIVDEERFWSLSVNPMSMNKFNPITNDFNAALSAYDSVNDSNFCNYLFCEDFRHKTKAISDDFALLHVNARSLVQNHEELELLLFAVDYKFTVIGISETWFLNDTSIESFSRNGYTLVHVDRPNRQGGGVALYVRNGVEFTLCSRMPASSSVCDSVFIEIYPKQINPLE